MSVDIVDRLNEYAKGYFRKHITKGPPKKLSKADQKLWDEWLKEKEAGKTDRPFKFWKKDRR